MRHRGSLGDPTPGQDWSLGLGFRVSGQGLGFVSGFRVCVRVSVRVRV